MADIHSKNIKEHVDDLEATFSYWGRRAYAHSTSNSIP